MSSEDFIQMTQLVLNRCVNKKLLIEERSHAQSYGWTQKIWSVQVALTTPFG